jgi:hypothetical protein
VQRRHRDGLGRRSACRARASYMDSGSVGHGPTGQRVGASGGCGGVSARGWHASAPERQRLGGACRRAAARQACAHRSCRLWPCHRGELAESGPAPAHRRAPLEHTDPRASPRGSDMRQPPRDPHGKGRWPCETGRGPPSSCGGAGSHHRVSRYRQTGCGQASRSHRTRGVGWWSIA